MNVTFLHTADIHLGTKFVNNKQFSLKEREKRRSELWDTFNEIINIAKKDKINYLLIAGDLIAESYSRFKDIQRIIKGFEQIPDTKVIITCGNNDPYSHITSMYRFVRWPENVYLFSNTDKTEVYTSDDDDDVCIYSVSWDEDKEFDVAEEIYNIKTDKDKINILLLHCDVNNQSEHSIDSNIIKYKFNYCALGHVHNYTEVERNIIYPGTPEPLNFTEEGQHGIISGEISNNHLVTTFVPIAKRKFVTREINLEVGYNFNRILDLIKNSGGKFDNMTDYVKVILNGTISNHISIDEIKNEASQFFYYIEFEDNYIYEKNLDEPDKEIKGSILESYIMQFENIDKTDKKYQQAFELGLQVLRREKVVN